MKKKSSLEKNATTVNKYLLSKLKGDPKSLYDASSHLIAHGGKRLRPYMVIKSCQMLGGNITTAMPAATAVELVHNFSLVHDDIMDNDEMRHGVPTTHKKYGMPLAILAGDVLFSKAYEIISNGKISQKSIPHLVSRLAKACVDICEGQWLDVSMGESKKIPSEKQYVTMIGKKTAALFDVSCAMGAICATNKQKDIQNLSAFGRNLGIAFQITDDLIGVMGDSKLTKKPVGNDLREGKKSLPILMALKKSKGNEKKKILKVFGNSKATKKQMQEAVKIIKSLGIEENVRKQAQKYADKSRQSLSKYSGAAKEEMIGLLDFVVKRSL
ncbi:MAG: polyprenyl synthetase family protein [Nitrosopumilaceae archaeon]|nr:polyprenyl synthetase family protein [Nitrosopumilaceae archaeon]